MSNELAVSQNLSLMEKIANDNQTGEDIKLLTSSRTNDQLKVFLIAQARNELTRVIKLTKFLDKLEESFMNQVDQEMLDGTLTLKQYSEITTTIVSLLTRSSEIISKVLKDDSLMTILNISSYSSDEPMTQASVIGNLKDAQSRERVRTVVQQVLIQTSNFVNSNNIQEPIISTETEI